MRIISLNTWCGRALHPLMHFFRNRRNDADIFCLQEVYDASTRIVRDQFPGEFVEGDMFNLIRNELTGFRGFFASHADNPDRMSLAMFVRDGIRVSDMDHFVVHRPQQPVETGRKVRTPRQLQYTVVEENGRDLLVANYHGIWTPLGKMDTPERLDQSRELRGFLDKHATAKILIGDLNLEPDTKSLHMLEVGLNNLVKRHGITSTRTPLYREYDNADVGQYADYALVSPDIQVNDFRVLPDLCSDHAALYLDCTVGADEGEA